MNFESWKWAQVATFKSWTNKSALSFFDFRLFHLQKLVLTQNLFLEVEKLKIKETKGTFIGPTFKISYWGPLSGLKSQDLIKTSRTFTGVILCRRPFWNSQDFFCLNRILSQKLDWRKNHSSISIGAEIIRFSM